MEHVGSASANCKWTVPCVLQHAFAHLHVFELVVGRAVCVAWRDALALQLQPCPEIVSKLRYRLRPPALRRIFVRDVGEEDALAAFHRFVVADDGAHLRERTDAPDLPHIRVPDRAGVVPVRDDDIPATVRKGAASGG